MIFLSWKMTVLFLLYFNVKNIIKFNSNYDIKADVGTFSVEYEDNNVTFFITWN